jgi:anti-sigma B factor antagonist
MTAVIEVRDFPDRNACEVVVSGRIYWPEAKQLEAQLACAVGTGRSTVTVDLRQMSFIASCGLGVLVRAHREVEGRGRTFEILQPEEPVLGVFRATRLTTVLPFLAPSECAAPAGVV